MQITYETNPINFENPEKILTLFENAGLSKPEWTAERMRKSINGSTTVVLAWQDKELIGFASAISDRAWIGYISQLAVSREYQRRGIGRNLIQKVLADLGNGVTVVVHSAEEASDFYKSVGFTSYKNVFVKPRQG
jgi:ribosomal protein S18 acetylase RimI-like enzyme